MRPLDQCHQEIKKLSELYDSASDEDRKGILLAISDWLHELIILMLNESKEIQ